MYDYKKWFQSKTLLSLIPLVVILLRQIGLDISETDINNILDSLVGALDSLIALCFVLSAFYGRIKASKKILTDKSDPNVYKQD